MLIVIHQLYFIKPLEKEIPKSFIFFFIGIAFNDALGPLFLKIRFGMLIIAEQIQKIGQPQYPAPRILDFWSFKFRKRHFIT